MVKIVKVGASQTGNSCGAFCLAAIAKGMGLINQQQKAEEKVTINYKPDKNVDLTAEIKMKLPLNDSAEDVGLAIYKVTGVLAKNGNSQYYYKQDNPKNQNTNSISGLALVASTIGLKVDVNILKDCGAESMNIYDTEKKLINPLKNTSLNEKVQAYKAPGQNEVQIVCVHEGQDYFAHWIAVDSDGFLYDPRTDQPAENQKKFSSQNTMDLQKGKYKFSGLWITLSK